MNAKRLILSLGMLVFVGAAVVGGTGAFFSDTETSTGNTFTAGEVDLTLASIGHVYTGLGQSPDVPTYTQGTNDDGFFFTLNDIKPLDEGTITYNLTNEDNQAYVCVLVENVTPEPSASDTALSNLMNFLFQGDSGTVAAVAGEWQSLGTFASAQTQNLAVDYCFGTFNGSNCVLDDVDYNPAQGGEMVIDVEFYAVQTRNNPNFTCASLNEPEPPTVNPGPVTFVDYAGARFRSFANTGGQEIYVGANDLGVAGNRVAAEYTWGATQPVTVSYNATAGEVTASVGNTPVSVTRVDGLSCDPSVMQINVAARDAGTSVALNNVVLGGFPLTPFTATFNQFNTWNISGFDFANDFVLTANLDLTGTFGTSQELSRVDVQFGCI